MGERIIEVDLQRQNGVQFISLYIGGRGIRKTPIIRVVDGIKSSTLNLRVEGKTVRKREEGTGH